MFKVPANTSGTITIKYVPYAGTSTKTLTCKVGDSSSDISGSGKKILTSDPIKFSVTEETPVYLYVSSNHEAFYIYDIAVSFNHPTVTISDADYATYCFDKTLNFSGTGITVYKAKLNNATKAVTLSEVSGGRVPKNTGVVLYKDVDASTSFTVPVIDDIDALADNELIGITTDTNVAYGPTDGKYNYILEKDGENIVFKKATAGGATLAANRAYLSTSYDVTPAGAPILSIVFGESETTGIGDVVKSEEAESKIYYNLNGQRLSKPTKGLCILNGKKVVLR